MPRVPLSQLKTLYHAHEIAQIWNASHNLPVIKHPTHGWISPNQYRAMNEGKPCPYCGKRMVYGKEFHSTSSKNEAIKRGYKYMDKRGKKVINQAGNLFFHPNYLTLDHKLNKARCPEKLFDYDNLEIICWRCNQEKGDNNNFELQHTYEYLDDLVDTTLTRYPML